MKPIRTERANQVFHPPRGGEAWCDPVWVERTTYRVSDEQELPCVKLTYELNADERTRLLLGDRLELTIIGGSMPPVSLRFVDQPALITDTS